MAAAGLYVLNIHTNEQREIPECACSETIAVHPSNPLVAVASEPTYDEDDRWIRAVDLSSGEIVADIRTPTMVVALEFSSNGKYLCASLSNAGDLYPHPGILVLDTVSWQELGRLEGHKEDCTCLAAAANSPTIASGGFYCKDIHTWDLDNLTLETTAEFTVDNLQSLEFLRSDRILAAFGYDRSILFGHERNTVIDNELSSVSKDGKHLVVIKKPIDYDNQSKASTEVNLVDAETDALVVTLDQIPELVSGITSAQAEGLAAVVWRDREPKTLTLYALPSGERLMEVEGCSPFALGQCGKLLVVSNLQREVYLYSII